jgi:glycosyltransferase involved in cell wall biosynthesis
VTRARRALVTSMSPLATDPRILREIEWLSADGWAVDTLGIGPDPDARVRTHFETAEAPAWTDPRIVKGLIHSLLPYRARFRILMGSRIPAGLTAEPRAYDLIVVNDVDLLPWVVDVASHILAPGGHVHLDLHEWHPAEPGPSPDFTSWLLRGYHAWMTDLLASPVFTSRSTVAPGLGELYAERYGVPPLAIIRNSPAFEPLTPSPVDPDAIDLAYHGNADPTRGLGILADTLGLLEPRFRLHLMLTGPQADRDALRNRLGEHGDRVTYHDPVPVTEIAQRINAWDLEVIFYPPTHTNLKFSLPNKLFEAVQGRLGVVVGESPDMARVVREYGFGTVVEGWTAPDLAAALNQLTVEYIARMKSAVDTAAAELNSSQERAAFQRVLGEAP